MLTRCVIVGAVTPLTLDPEGWLHPLYLPICVYATLSALLPASHVIATIRLLSNMQCLC